MRRSLTLAIVSLSFPALAWTAWEGSRLWLTPKPAARLIEPRLTDTDSYAPCDPKSDPQRVLSRSRCAGFPELGIIERREIGQEPPGQEEDASRGRTLDLERSALADLKDPRGAESLERAVRGLAKAAGTNPEDAESWSNLAAARFVLAQQLDDPAELVRALSAAQRAVRLDPSLPEARFNQALILDLIPLPEQAIAAWNEYLKLDGSSGWAREAREHRKVLEQPATPALWESRLAALREAVLRNDQAAVREIVAVSPQKARDFAQEDLLGNWGDQLLAGQDASGPLGIARAIGAALRDPSVRQAVQRIDQAVNQPDVLGELARGHRAYRDASRALRDLFVERSAPLWTEAYGSLHRGGSPMALWAELGEAGIDFYQGRLDEAFQRLQSVGSRAEEAGQLSLAGRARTGLGLIRVRQGRFSESLRHYQAAVGLPEKTGELESLGAVHTMIAENLRFLGQDTASWRHRYRALSLLSRDPSSMRFHNVLWEGGKAALEAGEPEAALVFQEEGLRVAEHKKDPGMIAEALLHRSAIHQALGDAQDALRDLEEARRLNARFDDRDIREKLDADLSLAEGKLQSPTDPRQALSSYSEALGYYEQKNLSLELVDVYLGRARAHLALGEDKEGGEDLSAALRSFERQRAGVTADAARLSYSETVQGLFDEMISLQARRGRPEEALALSDHARTVPLVRRAAEGRLELSPGLLQTIPDGVVFVEYALMRDRLMTWVVRRGHTGFTSRPLQPGELEGRVERFLSALRRDPLPKLESLSAELDDLLIPEEVRELPESVELCFIPDKILNAVPFAALRERGQGRYLIEKHPVAIAPSIAVSLDSRGRNRSRSGTGSSALLVAATVFDQSLGLKALPGVEAEIREIRSSYRDAVVLSGEDATRAKILAALGDRDVLQLSGHGIFNARNPDQSYLVVAPAQEPPDAGMLFASDIAGLPLDRLRLVILSACDTLGPRDSRTAGLSGIARPFLDAGVPAVLGTLWNAKDRAAEAVMPQFHRGFIQTGNVAAALREAQLKMLHGSDQELRSPASWGVFSVVGGSF